MGTLIHVFGIMVFFVISTVIIALIMLGFIVIIVDIWLGIVKMIRRKANKQ